MPRLLLPSLLLPAVLLGLVAQVPAAQAKTIEECFMDNVWYEQDDKLGKDALALGERYELVGHCLCPTGAERNAEDMNVYCRKTGRDYVCYKGSPLAGTQAGPFDLATRKACQ